MSEVNQSAIRIYSLGMVAANKEIDSDVLQVIPIEDAPFMDGELVSMPFDSEITGEDAAGGQYVSKVTTDQAIPAHWLRQNSTNRLTPPDIRRGMRVLLWRFADENKYWWSDIGLDRHLMKLETVIYQFSATPDEAADPTALGNCYYLEVSTHSGRITLQTSKANGEFCTYALQINAKDGRVVVADELGNEFTLDSAETIIGAINADGTSIALDRRDILAYAPDNFKLEALKSVDIKTNKFTLQCQTGNIEASTSFTLKTPSFINDATQTQVKGTLEVTGTSKFNAAMTATGIVSSQPIRGPSNTI